MRFININDYFLLDGSKAVKPKETRDLVNLNWMGRINGFLASGENFPDFVTVDNEGDNIVISPSDSIKGRSTKVNKANMFTVSLDYNFMKINNPSFKKDLYFDIVKQDKNWLLTPKEINWHESKIPKLDLSTAFKLTLRKGKSSYGDVNLKNWVNLDSIGFYFSPENGTLKITKHVTSKDAHTWSLRETSSGKYLQFTTCFPLDIIERVVEKHKSNKIYFYRGTDGALYSKVSPL